MDYDSCRSLPAMFFEQADRLGDKPFLWAKHAGRYQALGLLEEHRRQAAAAVVVHFPPSLLPAFLRLSGSRRNSRWGITEIDNHKLS